MRIWFTFQYYRLRLMMRIGVKYHRYQHPIMIDFVGYYRLGERTIGFHRRDGKWITYPDLTEPPSKG